MAPKTEISKICDSGGAPIPLKGGPFAHTLEELGMSTALLVVSCHAELGQETPTAAAMEYLCTLIWTKMGEINSNGGIDGVMIDTCADPNADASALSVEEKKKLDDFKAACRWLQARRLKHALTCVSLPHTHLLFRARRLSATARRGTASTTRSSTSGWATLPSRPRWRRSARTPTPPRA